MTLSQIDDDGRRFLARLNEQTQGDPSRQASMYTIGESLGFDRERAATVAQALIAAGLVQIMTLSGGVGISAEGAAAIQPAAGPDSRGAGLPRLGRSRVMPPPERLAIEGACAGLRQQAGSLGLDFEALSELVADLRTISAQLESTRPKTAIVRECLRSLAATLKAVPGYPRLGEITSLIGD